ncbi:hypothetical protein ACA910_008104 [Epithemia clementina (nom. ined.)]
MVHAGNRRSFRAATTTEKSEGSFSFETFQQRNDDTQEENVPLRHLYEPDFLHDNNELMECYNNMKKASAPDNNFKLTRHQYSYFVEIQSGKTAQTSGFEKLNHSFISIFYAQACAQCFRESKSKQCCAGDMANIDFSPEDPTSLHETLTLVCGSIKSFLAT